MRRKTPALIDGGAVREIIVGGSGRMRVSDQWSARY
jgi:hypothetical protein